MFVRCSRLPVFPIFLSCLFFLFFFFNHDREKHFVAPSEYNGARAPHVCLPTRGILIGNAIITSVIIPIPNDQGSLLLSLYSRVSFLSVYRTGEKWLWLKSKHRFTPRSRTVWNEWGCDSRNTSGTRAYPVTVPLSRDHLLFCTYS